MLGIVVSGFLSFTSWKQLIDRLSNSCYYILLKKKKERKKLRPLKNKTTLCSNCCGVLLWTKEVLTLSMQCLWVGYSLSIGSCFSCPLLSVVTARPSTRFAPPFPPITFANFLWILQLLNAFPALIHLWHCLTNFLIWFCTTLTRSISCGGQGIAWPLNKFLSSFNSLRRFFIVHYICTYTWLLGFYKR